MSPSLPIHRMNRRTLLLATGSLFACRSSQRESGPALESAVDPSPDGARIDRLLSAYAAANPELKGGVGINHYPMAAEVLESFGASETVKESWIQAATRYDEPLGRTAPLTAPPDFDGALGHFDRYGDFLDAFALALDRRPWREVVADWSERLAPYYGSAIFHGVLRTGHAVRALTRRETPARTFELACGLAYWAARASEIPTSTASDLESVLRTAPEAPFRTQLATLAHPFASDRAPANEVQGLLIQCTLPPASAFPSPEHPETALDEIVHEAAFSFLEALIAKRHRVWMLHTVTGPAALEWILPWVSPQAATRLVQEARRAVLSTSAALGQPFERGKSLREVDETWSSFTARAVESSSVHTLKLVDALQRFAKRHPSPVWKSVADEYFQWT